MHLRAALELATQTEAEPTASKQSTQLTGFKEKIGERDHISNNIPKPKKAGRPFTPKPSEDITYPIAGT